MAHSNGVLEAAEAGENAELLEQLWGKASGGLLSSWPGAFGACSCPPGVATAGFSPLATAWLFARSRFSTLNVPPPRTAHNTRGLGPTYPSLGMALRPLLHAAHTWPPCAHAAFTLFVLTYSAALYFGFYTRQLDLGWLYDNFAPLLTASVIFSSALSVYLYASSFKRGALLSAHGNSGCVLACTEYWCWHRAIQAWGRRQYELKQG